MHTLTWAVFMLPPCGAFGCKFGVPSFSGFALLCLMFRPMLGVILPYYSRYWCFLIALFLHCLSSLPPNKEQQMVATPSFFIAFS